MKFPKPPDKPKGPALSLSSKTGLISQIEEREAALKQRFEELSEMERQMLEEREQLDATRHELEERIRALVENEQLHMNQKLLYQKQFSQLMDQNELVDLRRELEKREQDFQQKEAFLTQTQQRMSEQFAAREQDLVRREAWVSAEHEKATQRQSRRLQAIVFTDVVSYSALMQADEGMTIRKVRADLQRMQDDGKEQGGVLINTMGDGMLMIFPSAIQAVRFSLEMQRKFFHGRENDGLQHRFGIHIADVALLQDGGIAGDGVNIASRLESKAPNGGICISSLVHFLVKGKLQLPTGELEHIALKNITEPVAVYKFPPEAIMGMEDPSKSTPPTQILPDEERTAPPFSFGQKADPAGESTSGGG